MGFLVDQWLHTLRITGLVDEQLKTVAVSLGQAMAALTGSQPEALQVLGEFLVWVNAQPDRLAPPRQ